MVVHYDQSIVDEAKRVAEESDAIVVAHRSVFPQLECPLDSQDFKEYKRLFVQLRKDQNVYVTQVDKAFLIGQKTHTQRFAKYKKNLKNQGQRNMDSRAYEGQYKFNELTLAGIEEHHNLLNREQSTRKCAYRNLTTLDDVFGGEAFAQHVAALCSVLNAKFEYDITSNVRFLAEGLASQKPVVFCTTSPGIRGHLHIFKRDLHNVHLVDAEGTYSFITSAAQAMYDPDESV